MHVEKIDSEETEEAIMCSKVVGVETVDRVTYTMCTRETVIE